MSRQTRADGQPRNQWFLWMARRSRMDGKHEQELVEERRADELSHAEKRAQYAAGEREFARKLRGVGNEALARHYETRADELERPIVYPWPGGTSRMLAEVVATALWPDAPVADAPDAALHGILDHVAKYKPQLIHTARATLLDNGFTEAYAARMEDAQRKSKEQTDAFHAENEAKRVTVNHGARTDNAAPDPFDPLTNGVGEYASPHATAGAGELGHPAPGRKKKKAR